MAWTGDERVLGVAPVLAALGLLAAVLLGAYWTGSAVAEGSVGATLVRFVVSVGCGLYYLSALRVVTGRGLARRK